MQNEYLLLEKRTLKSNVTGWPCFTDEERQSGACVLERTCPCQGRMEPARYHAASRGAAIRVSGTRANKMIRGAVMEVNVRRLYEAVHGRA